MAIDKMVETISRTNGKAVTRYYLYRYLCFLCRKVGLVVACWSPTTKLLYVGPA